MEGRNPYPMRPPDRLLGALVWRQITWIRGVERHATKQKVLWIR